MLEVEIKLCYAFGRKVVPNLMILKLVLCESLSEFCNSVYKIKLQNMRHSRICPQIPEKCLSYC